MEPGRVASPPDAWSYGGRAQGRTLGLFGAGEANAALSKDESAGPSAWRRAQDVAVLDGALVSESSGGAAEPALFGCSGLALSGVATQLQGAELSQAVRRSVADPFVFDLSHDSRR